MIGWYVWELLLNNYPIDFPDVVRIRQKECSELFWLRQPLFWGNLVPRIASFSGERRTLVGADHAILKNLAHSVSVVMSI